MPPLPNVPFLRAGVITQQAAEDEREITRPGGNERVNIQPMFCFGCFN